MCLIMYRFSTSNSDVHIKKDIERCLKSVSDSNLAGIDQSAGLVRGRCARLMRVVRADMEENPTRYSGGHEARIFSAFVRLREKGKIACTFCIHSASHVMHTVNITHQPTVGSQCTTHIHTTPGVQSAPSVHVQMTGIVVFWRFEMLSLMRIP